MVQPEVEQPVIDVLIDSATKEVLSYGTGLAVADETQEVVQVPLDEIAKFDVRRESRFSVSGGRVVVTPVPQNELDQKAADLAQAVAAAEAERTTIRRRQLTTDLRALGVTVPNPVN